MLGWAGVAGDEDLVEDTAARTAELVDAGAVEVAPPTVTPWRSLNSRLDAPAGLQITLFQEPGIAVRPAVAADWPAIWPSLFTILATVPDAFDHPPRAPSACTSCTADSDRKTSGLSRQTGGAP